MCDALLLHLPKEKVCRTYGLEAFFNAFLAVRDIIFLNIFDGF